MRKLNAILSVLLITTSGLFAAQAAAPEWIEDVRPEHPRLFINEDIAEVLKANANGREAKLYASIKARVDKAMKQQQSIQFVLHEGIIVDAAVVALVSDEPKYKQQVLKWLDEGITHVEALYNRKEKLGWFSFQRMGLLIAYDWFYADLTPAQRTDYAKRLMEHVELINTGKIISGENRYGFPNGGFYGTNNLYWYAGITFHGEGVDDAKADAWIQRGWSDMMTVAAHRKSIAGDDGGLSAPVPGYAMGAYPRAEWNFLHTSKSAFGQSPTEYFDYLPLFLNWITWTMITGNDGLHDYGFGDSHHTGNRINDLKDLHLSHIRYFFQEDSPEYAQLAQYLMEVNPSDSRGDYFWGELYPLLLPSEAEPIAASGPNEAWPNTRFFEHFGQFFMRSGNEPDSTYAMFLAGAVSAGHKHFDDGHFTIYKNGFQAVDTGTRDQADSSGKLHNTEYYNRTIAHNTLLIKMPEESFPHHWGNVPQTNDGGQNKANGSEVLAFETNDYFTNIVADLTLVYSAKKAEQVIRQFIYIMPNQFVILDRVTSTQVDYPKTWLLHTQTEPEVNGNQWSSTWEDGVMHVKTLLPATAKHTVIGGPGQEFMVNGVNYPISEKYIKSAKKKESLESFQDMLVGHWRMEVTPEKENTTDVFLHVIEVGDKNELKSMHAAELISDPQSCIIQLATAKGEATITLDKQDPLKANIRITEGGKVVIDQALTPGIAPQEGLAFIDESGK